MEGERRFHGLSNAIITAVVREGPDVLLTFRNARLERRSMPRLRFMATMRFVDAHRINSVHCWNAAIDCRLEPGWQVSWLTFDDLYADVCVQFINVDVSIDVAHRIWCDTVQLETRFAPIDTMKAYYFPASFCQICSEPAPSAPIEGQGGPMIC